MDKEDVFLTETLKKVYDQILDERTDITRMDGQNAILAAEYDEAIERLNRLMREIKGVTDLYELDEEDFLFILDRLEMYSESFIVDGRQEEKLRKDLEDYEELSAFLEQFYDDEDDYDEDDYEEEEEGDAEKADDA